MFSQVVDQRELEFDSPKAPLNIFWCDKRVGGVGGCNSELVVPSNIRFGPLSDIIHLFRGDTVACKPFKDGGFFNLGPLIKGRSGTKEKPLSVCNFWANNRI